VASLTATFEMNRFSCSNGAVDGAVGGEEDDVGRGPLRPELLQDVEAVLVR